MVVKREASKRIADVVIPEHLLTTVDGTQEWTADKRDRVKQRLNGSGPVQNALHRHANLCRDGKQLWRSSTVNHGARSRPDRVGRPRKTSDPITTYETESAQASRTKLPLAPLKPLRGSNTFMFDENPSRSQEPTRSQSRSAVSSAGSSCYDSDLPRVSSEGYGTERNQVPQRSGTIKTIVHAVVPDAVQQTARNVTDLVRKSSIYDVYTRAKSRGVELERKRWVQILFECSIYLLLVCFIYFVLVGMPLWHGAVYWMYWVVDTKFVLPGGWSITLGIAVLYSFSPLLIFFEKEPPIIEHPADFDRNEIPGVRGTALLIPCYKSANIVGPTLAAALKVFPPSNIFVIANGNSPTPLDTTEEVCRPYGVNHIWCPVGSKIVAQFVGCYAAKGFENVLLIDDDCALPPNFPVVSDRLKGNVQSIGYTIKSVGPDSSKGTWCQQAQDLEYKISGLQRALAGEIGSATFPHGAISLWNRQFLIRTFHDHPGFSVSEDWFFGHSCRRLGGRIKMCTSIFVETETPPAVFFSSGGSRGGFGEMTVFKQRFLRWNFFFVNGMWYNMAYILFSWKLGWWEIGAKLFVFQEVYETLLYLLTPFVITISFIVQPSFCGILLGGTVLLYLINVLIFNEVHLRMRSERISWTVLLVYYMPYKLILTLVNVGSCYWSLYKYARYFAKRHPKVIEDEKAVEVVMRLEEMTPVGSPTGSIHSNDIINNDLDDDDEDLSGGRRMRVTAVGTRLNLEHTDRVVLPKIETVTVNKRTSFIAGAEDCITCTPSLLGPQELEERQVQIMDFASAENPSTLPPRLSLGFDRGREKTSWSKSPV